jgi:hypothetical protein
VPGAASSEAVLVYFCPHAAKQGLSNAGNYVDRDSGFGTTWWVTKMVAQQNWGYYPTGGVGLALLIVILLPVVDRM